mgnify:CR=1 FL=1
MNLLWGVLLRSASGYIVAPRPTVMATPGAPALGPRVTIEPVFRDPAARTRYERWLAETRGTAVTIRVPRDSGRAATCP